MRPTVVSMMYAPAPPYNGLHNGYGIRSMPTTLMILQAQLIVNCQTGGVRFESNSNSLRY